MKSRSHRLPMSEPRHDDWVDGSWTVDCICGVNFDDGEEMVDCDECGVWVHTRCSRYVKGEKSFACDKCKSKNSVGGLRNYSEETEVAEFLVELPTKTMLERPNPSAMSARKASKLWTDIPMEKRVHVQGIPGGESGFFQGSKMSSIFGPQLWNCAGYVPKKFNFRYTEFPCLFEESSEDDMLKENGEEDEEKVKDDAETFISMLSAVKHTLNSESVPANKNLAVENPGLPCPGEENTTTPEPVVLDSAMCEASQIPILNDQNAMNLSTTEKDGGIDKQARESPSGDITHASPLMPPPSSDTRHMASCCSPKECVTNSALKGHDLNHINPSRVENKEAELLPKPESFSKSSSNVKSTNTVADVWIKPEMEPLDSSQSSGVGTRSAGRLAAELPVMNPKDGCLLTGGNDGQTEADQKPLIYTASERPAKKQKCELLDAVDEHCRIESLHQNEINLNSGKDVVRYPDSHSNMFTGVQVPKTLPVVSENHDSRLHYASENRNRDAVFKTDNSGGSPAHAYILDLESKTSDFGSGPRKKSLKVRNGSEVPGETFKLSGDSPRYSASYQNKVGGNLVKSVSNSGSMVCSSSDDHVGVDAKSRSALNSHKELSECSSGSRKNSSSADMLERNSKCGRPKNIARESSGSYFVSKLDSTKISDSKDLKSSTTGSHMRNHSSTRFSDDGGRSLGSQDKISSSLVSSKGEKVRHSSSQILSKGNMNSVPVSSNVPAALSDEELALLLHQELNSSPRVPRVPRMRQGSSFPPITNSGATSMLMKRSSGGGKDQNLSYRKRSKDLAGDASRGYLRSNLETKKVDRKSSSPDNTRQDSASSIDRHSRKEADCGSIKHVQPMKNALVSGLPSHTYGYESLANRPSPRNAADDGSQISSYRRHHTLPGLIAEIMSEGRRMTYEELCNAVLPHWPHLRKHNGERYAYSSHSQAVLDCLRNRSEWARLVDRGPKTNAGKKRRKNDADSFNAESEENEDISVKIASKSSKDDIPKGKRNARKPRADTSQEKTGIITRGRRSDTTSYYESESSSDFIEEDASSEDEAQGDDDDGMSPVRNDGSSGSEDTA